MEVAFMPWAGLQDTIAVGPVFFSPFDPTSTLKLVPNAVRDRIAKYFASYVDHDGRPVDAIALCSIGPLAFQPLTAEERVVIRRAVDTVILATIAKTTSVGVCQDNDCLAPPHSERYQLMFQSFDLNSGHVAVQAGNTLSVWNLDVVRFAKPWSTGGEPIFGFDECTLDGLSKLLEDSTHTGDAERIFRALEWFRLANVGSDDVSPTAKIVMMGTAFEILFGSSGINEKFKTLATKLDVYLCDDDLRRYGIQPGDSEYTTARWWFFDFYQLRNRVTHGDVIEPDGLRYDSPNHDWLSHAIVANLVFWECVLWNLFDLGLVGSGAHESAASFAAIACNVAPDEAFVRHVARSFFGFDAYQESLAWTKDENEAEVD